MAKESQPLRYLLISYDDIDHAIAWLRGQARNRSELYSLIVRYYAVDLDMLAKRLSF